IHRFDLILEASRGWRHAKLAIIVHNDCRAANRCAANAGDKCCTMGGVHYALPDCKRDLVPDADGVGLGSNTSIADIDIITTSEIFTGSDAERNVKIAYYIGGECMGALHSIKTTRRVSKKRDIAVGRIVVTRRIAKQCSNSIRCIVESGSVAKKRCSTDRY